MSAAHTPRRKPAANRGVLSNRQWNDVDKAIVRAKAHGVTLSLHGIRISGDPGTATLSPAARQRTNRRTPRDAPPAGRDDRGAAVPMDAVANAPRGAAKKWDRDQRRAEENRARRVMSQRGRDSN